MPRIKYLLPLVALLLAVSCKSEKKVTTYNELYREKPVTILVAPVQDNAKRPMVKTTQDRVLNDELSACEHGGFGAYYFTEDVFFVEFEERIVVFLMGNNE